MHNDQRTVPAHISCNPGGGVTLLLGQDRPFTGTAGHPETTATVRYVVLEKRPKRFLIYPTILRNRRRRRWEYAFEFQSHCWTDSSGY
jgi:hypothetical protein